MVKGYYTILNTACNLGFRQYLFLLGIVITLSSCATSSRLSSQKEKEVFQVRVLEDKTFLDFPASLVDNNKVTGTTRGGFLLPLFGSAVSYASNSIKNMISHERSKYTSSYCSNKNDLFFYNNITFTDNLDPSGMIFKGIEIIRTIQIEGKMDTALYAVFHIERNKTEELVNNSTFRLVVDTINIKYASTKVATGYWYLPWTYFNKKKCKFDLDVDIRFTSSWVTENTQIYNDIKLGSFILQLRDIPLDNRSKKDSSYFSSLKGKEFIGKCFIVPRSYGHLKNGDEMQACYGQGLYNVEVCVRETSKSKYLKITDNSSDKMMNMLQQILSNKAIRYLPAW